ncbi:SGNH/GDSL hydrolase family protein [Thalassotalea aquiviva]|uniref:SGNH/GDSL hydrolase family protein n=1 Tax=Thalassotalea aquiviva TaxID=3242415 RepID=UPI00352B85AB
MVNSLKKLALLPLLPVCFIQGKTLRKQVPKLAEPKGERFGHTGNGKPLRLMITGDSAAAGVGVEHQDQALIGQVCQQLSQHFAVQWSLEAKTGATTASTIRHLTKLPECKLDVVVTSIGLNDLTTGKSRTQWLKNLNQLLDLMDSKYQPNLVIISGLPPVGQFPVIPSPLRWFLGFGAQGFNQAMAKLLSKRQNAHYLPIELPTQSKVIPTELMASDGFHPGAKVYQQWAQDICQVIKSRFI